MEPLHRQDEGIYEKYDGESSNRTIPQRRVHRIANEGVEQIVRTTNIANSKPCSQFTLTKSGYIDVGDGCWRPNELVTSLRCW